MLVGAAFDIIEELRGGIPPPELLILASEDLLLAWDGEMT